MGKLSKLRKPFVPLLLALIVFGGFVIASNIYIGQNVNLVDIVAAAEAIPPRTEIQPEMLKITQIPKGYLPEGFATSTKPFTEKKYYTGDVGIHIGEAVTKEKVFTAEEISHSHTLTLEPGETILGISTDLVRSAGAAIYPGSRVRALAYIPAKEDMGTVIIPSTVEVVFDDLRVVGVVNTEGSDSSDDEQRRKVPSVVKLAVTPDQERILIQYQTEYKVWFTLLPEGYEPDPEIIDYNHRAKLGKESELHTNIPNPYPPEGADTSKSGKVSDAPIPATQPQTKIPVRQFAN